MLLFSSLARKGKTAMAFNAFHGDSGFSRRACRFGFEAVP